MRVAFYAPLKAPTHGVPSGDRSIAADLWEAFGRRGHERLLLSDFRALWFYSSPARTGAAAAALAAAAARAARFAPDLFFTYHLYHKAPDAIAAPLARLWGRPYVVYEASHAESARRRPATALGYHLAKAALRGAAHVFSGMTADLPGLRGLLPGSRVSYVPPCVDPERFAPDPAARARWRARRGVGDSEVLVACAAMLRADRKAAGVRLLLEALGGLARRGLRFRLVLAGGGQCLDEVRALARARLGGAALVLGALERAEVAETLKASDLFAFPGLGEGFGLAYLEAQACGLPVAALRDGGVPDAVAHGVTGLLTPPGDGAAYAAALSALIADAGLRARLGREARARMLERHHPAVNYGAVVARCEALASGRRT